MSESLKKGSEGLSADGGGKGASWVGQQAVMQQMPGAGKSLWLIEWIQQDQESGGR